MAQGTDAKIIAQAYESELRARVLKAIESQPPLAPLMVDIAQHIINLRKTPGSESIESADPPTKKRRLNGSHIGNDEEGSIGDVGDEDRLISKWQNSFLLPDVSFVVPQRKKLSLELGSLENEGIRAVTPKDNTPEFSIPWTNIEHAVCLPVPEKAAVAFNFCIFPRGADGVTDAPEQAEPREPMVWTISDPKAKGIEADWKSPRETIVEVLERMNVDVVAPSASEFVSEVPQPHRKGEKAYHVKAFRGSKDGFLFFLPTGIIWGFKKPLYFFSFITISAISYTSVLQRTFNLNISTLSPNNLLNHQEFEFSMIDQADFAGIDEYVKRHRLHDASMAEQRRAKKLNINGLKGEKTAEDEDEEGELEKARKELERQGGDDDDNDEEDEDENFDPGSEGESEGSGSSSDEEDGGEEIGEGENLVEEELGSEAEEI